MSSFEFRFALSAGIVNNILRKGKKSKKYILLFMPHPRPANFPKLYDQNGNGFEKYFEIRRKARNNSQKICVVITIHPEGATSAHTEVMIDDLTGNVTVFDNSGTFGTDSVQKQLFDRIKAMTQRRTGYSKIKRLPMVCPRINESRPYCTYWSALFLQYMLERPTKTIDDFVKYILKKHQTKSVNAVKYHLDSMLPDLRKIGCDEAKRLVNLEIIDMPRECRKSISINMERLKL
tara:strand:+ start:148 stop:849 length:702 start_codon:yes stop_codon:yes gene_type:complete